MAVTIAEPNDLPAGSLNPDTEANTAILVYQRAQDSAGIKKMGIANWKEYLGFNGHKVDNLASYIGVENTYPWDVDSDNPYTGTVLTSRINNIATQCGVSTEAASGFTPLLNRVEDLKGKVETGYTDTTVTPPVNRDGLLTRVLNNETNISSILEEIGSGGGGGGQGSLTARMNDAETNITALQHSVDGNPGATPPTQGLLARATALENILGQHSDGGDPATGLCLDVETLQATVGNNSSGLVKDVNDLKTTVGDNSSGLVKEVNDIKTTISAAYVYQGNITGVDNPSTTTVIYTSTHPLPDGIPLTSLENGWVYNILPSIGDTITINGTTFTKDTNVAWVEGTPGNFDRLGTAIDVTRVDTLETQVTALESRFYTVLIGPDETWDSSDVPDGIYLFTSNTREGGQLKLCSFIVGIYSGGSESQSPFADLTNNFNTYFTIDQNTLLLSTVSLTGVSRQLSYTKIGEVFL